MSNLIEWQKEDLLDLNLYWYYVICYNNIKNFWFENEKSL